MAKKDDTKGLANIGKGILSSLEDINDIKEENSKSVTNETNNESEEEKKKQVKTETSIEVKEEKKKKQKKNFMLSETAVNQLFDLKFKYRKKDYSQIVEEAIMEYYQKYI